MQRCVRVARRSRWTAATQTGFHRHMQQHGLIYPEETAMHAHCMRRKGLRGDVSNSYVDSFALPRAVFGRFAALSVPFTERGVYLEVALPTAICMTSWNDERVPQVG